MQARKHYHHTARQGVLNVFCFEREVGCIYNSADVSSLDVCLVMFCFLIDLVG